MPTEDELLWEEAYEEQEAYEEEIDQQRALEEHERSYQNEIFHE